MNYKSMIEVEYDMSGIERYVTWQHDLPIDWYGEIYPDSIRKIMTDMWLSQTKEEYEEAYNIAESMFNTLAEQAEEENTNEIHD